MTRCIHRDFPYLNNTRADIRLVGFPAALTATVAWSSAARLGMFASMCNQALIVKGNEFNRLFSGMERNYGEYTFDFSRRECDVEVVDVFPKYQAMRSDARDIGMSPQHMVIYREVDTLNRKSVRDLRIGYFTIDRYFYMSDGFGCENVLAKNINTWLRKGMIIPQEEKLVSQPNQQGEKYNFGVNANTVYMTMSQTNEDAMVISESLAAKLESLEMRRIFINVMPDGRPLNLYGTDDHPKIFPDIGEQVRDDGILFGARQISTATYAADTDPVALREVQPLCDSLVVVPKGSVVADIEIYSSRKSVASLYHQVVKYQDGLRKYHDKIVENYNKIKKTSRITPEFSSLVANSMTHQAVSGHDQAGLLRRGGKPKIEVEGMDNHPIESIQIVITLKIKRKVGLGFKTSGTDGSLRYVE